MGSDGKVATAVLEQKLDDFIKYQRETNDEIKNKINKLSKDINGNFKHINEGFKEINNRCSSRTKSFNETIIRQGEAIKHLSKVSKKKGEGLLARIINTIIK